MTFGGPILHRASCYTFAMTLEEFLKQSADPLFYGEQDENGVNLSIIRRNRGGLPRSG